LVHADAVPNPRFVLPTAAAFRHAIPICSMSRAGVPNPSQSVLAKAGRRFVPAQAAITAGRGPWWAARGRSPA